MGEDTSVDPVSNITYRGTDSTTYRMVLLAFFTATLMLTMDKISGDAWVTGALGLVATYVAKQIGVAASEAYRDKQ